MTSLEDRVAALEKAVAALTAERAQHPAPPAAPPESPDLWMLDGLRERAPGGAIGLVGTVPSPAGELAWQWARPTAELLDSDWAPAAARLDALSSPVRLGLLQRVLAGADTTAALADDEELGTTGQLHHHLRALVGGGWLVSVGRGRWRIPPQRVVPLLAILLAALE